MGASKWLTWLQPTALTDPCLDACPGEGSPRGCHMAQSHPGDFPGDVDGDADCWARLPRLPHTGGGGCPGVKGPGIKPVLIGVCVLMCVWEPCALQDGVGWQQLHCGVSQKGWWECWDCQQDATLQDVKWFRSGPRKPWISEAQHTPKPHPSANLISLFTTPFPFCPFQEAWLFPQPKSPFPLYPSVSVPFGTGWFSRCTARSSLTYTRFPKGF